MCVTHKSMFVFFVVFFSCVDEYFTSKQNESISPVILVYVRAPRRSRRIFEIL